MEDNVGQSGEIHGLPLLCHRNLFKLHSFVSNINSTQGNSLSCSGKNLGLLLAAGTGLCRALPASREMLGLQRWDRAVLTSAIGDLL